MFPIDDHFGHLCNGVFRIETHWAEGGKPIARSATGFAMAKFNQRLVIATAQHVLDFPDEADVAWKVQQFDDNSRVEREICFGTNKKKLGQVPYRTHNWFDIGLFAAPEKTIDGKSFSPEAEMPLALIAQDLMVTTGTRVGWAGFCGAVGSFLGSPHLCYAEGVVSTIVNRDNRHWYIVDGHNRPGFSGGPVWAWWKDEGRFRVVGIVSGYKKDQIDDSGGFPGFCYFEPINELRFYLNSWKGSGTVVFND